MIISILSKLVILVFIIISSAYPQYEEEAELYEIVVTGTKSSKSLKEGPVRTEVVTSQEIEHQRYRDLSEAILDIPGVTLQKATGKQGKTALIQGLSGDHVLVLIDGVPIIQNSSSGFDLGQIPTSDIARIEVVKGGTSSLYGGQAMGGVINIITKKAKNPFEYHFQLQKDFFEEKNQFHKDEINFLSAQVKGKTDLLEYKFLFSRAKEGSLDFNEESIARDTPDIEKKNYNAYLAHYLNERTSLSLDFNFYQEDNKSYLSRLQPDTSFLAVENIGAIEGKRAKIQFKKEFFNNSKLDVYFLTERIQDHLSLENNPQTNFDESLKRSDLKRNRFETQYDFLIGEDHILLIGAVYDESGLDQVNATQTSSTPSQETIEVDDKSSRSYEAYLQDDWIIGKGEIVSGIRYTNDEFFGDNISPKLNLSYSPSSNSIIRLSYGSGFRIPSLKERFYVLDHRSFAGYIIYGNEELKPEVSQSYQAGIEFNWPRQFNFALNFFRNDIDNLITIRELDTPSTEREFTYQNVNQSRMEGVELSGFYTFLSESFRFSYSYTYTKAFDKNSNLIIPNQPHYLGQASLLYQLPNKKADFIYTFRYFGDSYADNENTETYRSYSVSDIRGNYHLTNNVGVFIGVKNIFDSKRESVLDGAGSGFDQRPSIGRTIFAGINIEG